MIEYETFTQEEIIIALEFDIKHYKSKRNYHLNIAQVYVERINKLHDEILKIRQKSVTNESD